MAQIGWGDITDDLLFLLVEKIVGFTTFVRFSAVCKVWHSVASATKCPKLVPWLMLTEKEGTLMRDFYDHTTGEIYQLPLPHMPLMRNAGFAHGWLILVDVNGYFHMLNPVTGVVIHLPSLTSIIDMDLFTPIDIRNCLTIKVTFSLMGPNGDCTLALAHKGFGCFRLSYWRPGQKEWIMSEFDVGEFAGGGEFDVGGVEVAFVKGAFYVVTIFSEILTCDFASTPRFTEIARLPDELMKQCDFNTAYVVECHGDILIVAKLYELIDLTYHFTTFRVFKLDEKKKQVVELKGIGDYALLLGTNVSFCLPTALYGKWFKKNCIYFTEIPLDSEVADPVVGDHMSEFNLEDGSLTTQTLTPFKSDYNYPIWVFLDLQDIKNKL